MTAHDQSPWEDFEDRRVPSLTRDLAGVPADVEALEVQTKAFTDWDGLLARRRLRRLALVCLKPEHLPALARLEQLEALWLADVRVESLAALAGLRRLRTLAIACAPKLPSLAGVSGMRELHWLSLSDLPRLASLDELTELANLRELKIASAPSRDSRGPQRFPSLQPLANLPQLKRLSLIGVATLDQSLQALHGLRGLRDIHLANTFPLDEYARLAGALPRARGNFAEPVWEAPLAKCLKCGLDKVLLLGAGTRTVCKGCGAAKIASHIAEFERIRDEGRAMRPTV